MAIWCWRNHIIHIYIIYTSLYIDKNRCGGSLIWQQINADETNVHIPNKISQKYIYKFIWGAVWYCNMSKNYFSQLSFSVFQQKNWFYHIFLMKWHQFCCTNTVCFSFFVFSLSLSHFFSIADNFGHIFFYALVFFLVNDESAINIKEYWNSWEICASFWNAHANGIVKFDQINVFECDNCFIRTRLMLRNAISIRIHVNLMRNAQFSIHIDCN